MQECPIWDMRANKTHSYRVVDWPGILLGGTQLRPVMMLVIIRPAGAVRIRERPLPVPDGCGRTQTRLGE